LRGGGTEQYVYEITQNLSRNIEYVEVISDVSVYHEFRDNVKVTEINSLEPSLNTGFIGWVLTHLFGGIFSTFTAIRKIFSSEYDIVHIHSRFNGYFVCLLNKYLKKFKIVYTLHNSGPWLCKYESKFEELMQKIAFILFDLFVIKNSDNTIVLSEKLRNDLLWRWGIDPEKMEVIYNGVDSSTYRREYPFCDETLSKFDIAKGYILFVGQLHPRKGLFYLLEAMKDLDYPCVIVGDGPQREALRNFIEKNDMNNVKLTGSVTRRELICFYKKAEFFVLPSTAEALPLTILESMSAGLPLITTDVGAIPEIIDNGSNGLIVKPYNPEALKNAINKMMNNKELLKSMSENNKEKAIKEFDWSSVIKKIVNLYQRV
jgi:glycosyltransferase involved in cell wall biosynthesis